MITYYVYRVRMKKIDIEDVPEKYRDAVRKKLEAWD
ncbi:CD1375 family protein [Megasphaera sp.]|jgi:hypothetical protein|nr:MAG TPA: Protein of unknown function (DUF3283) [Caudoviricetes sp.]